MDKILEILNHIWSFLNSSWFPLLIGVVGLLYFAITYIRTNRAVNKYRAECQQKIVNDAFAEYYHQKYFSDDQKEKATDSSKAD